ncbi:MAG: hypothetical protein OXG82_05480 [Gammaproteobacteria bacterium]|nr:hypothetical protein [Gammaproteobacteria bacterium]
MELQDICSRAVAGTEGVRGCLLLDMETGLPLAQATTPTADLATERIVADTHRIFRGGLVAQFARALSPPRDLPGFVEEAQLTTAEAQHFMASVPGWEGALVVLVADKALRVGIGWMCIREACRRLADARPADGERRDPAGPVDGVDAAAPSGSLAQEPDEGIGHSAASPAVPDMPAGDEADSPATAAAAEPPDRGEALQPEPPVLEPETEPPPALPDPPAPPRLDSTEPPRAEFTEPPRAETAGPPPAEVASPVREEPAEPPLMDLPEPPRVARGRAPSIRARRSIPMAQLLREPESGDAAQGPGAPPGAESPHSEVGRLGARASLRPRTKRP